MSYRVIGLYSRLGNGLLAEHLRCDITKTFWYRIRNADGTILGEPVGPFDNPSDCMHAAEAAQPQRV